MKRFLDLWTGSASLLERLSSWRMQRLFQRRNFQEEMDTFQLSLAASVYSRFASVEEMPSDSSECLKEAGVDELVKRSYDDHKRAVSAHLDPQVLSLFQHVAAVGGRDPYPTPLNKNDRKDQIWSAATKERMKEQTREHTKKLEDIMDKPIEHPEGFKFRVTHSTIEHPEAGFGVVVEGTARPGTILAFYPGRVYFPEDLREEVVTGNHYLISRYDGTVIDGQRWQDDAVEIRHKGIGGEFSGMNVRPPSLFNNNTNNSGIPMELLKYHNMYAVGNYINHPAPGQSPNVLCYAYDFEDRVLPEELHHYIPNRYHREPKLLYMGGGLMRGLVCVATRVIKDEELLLNYRLNPNLPFPQWYSDPNPEESKLRWSKMRVL